MNFNEFEEILRKILADWNVSRGEKDVFRELLRDARPNEYELARLRSRAFEVVREKCLGPESHAALEGLEEVLKLLLPAPKCEECCDVLFSPDDDCPTRIADLLRSTSSTADICVYTITDDRIAKCLLALHDKGAKLRIVTDGGKLNEPGSDIARLAKAGVAVRSGNRDYLMHHKFAILDGRVLLTGSYNWTRTAAEVNKENVLITHNKHLLSKYVNAFGQLWRELGAAAAPSSAAAPGRPLERN